MLLVEVEKYGRFVLPKKIRQKYNIAQGTRLIVTVYMGRICLFPIKEYDNPTEALYGSIKVERPIDDPQGMGREQIHKKLLEDL
jgi:AbrB family looped-hinge helix DNA binding protein